MTADHSSDAEGRQRTVAELLQQYGGEGRGGSRRRRRAEERAEEDASPDTGSPASGTDPLPRRVPGSETAGFDPLGLHPEPVAPHGDGRPDNGLPDNGYPENGYSGSAEWSTGSGLSGTSAFAGSGTGVSRAPLHRPDPLSPDYRVDSYPGTGTRQRRDPGERTDVIPRYDRGATPEKPPAAGPGTVFTAPANLFADDPDDEPPAKDPSGSSRTALGTEPAEPAETAEPAAAEGKPGARNAPDALLDRRARRGRTEDTKDTGDAKDPGDAKSQAPPAGLTSEDAEQAEKAAGRRGAKVWLSLIGQWVLGAIGGAALWLGFSYLWQRVPVIALAAAVAATAALVLLVRAIRHSDDLQTTMLAVLVGLVVTISPAVLLLAVR